MPQSRLETQLLEWRLINNVSGGIQIDINAAVKKIGLNLYRDSHSCDHNCTRLVGKYDCPAAYLRNRGVDLKSYAPKEKIIESLVSAAGGLRTANRRFVEDGLFKKYCESFMIPKAVARIYRRTLLNPLTEINFFGGNPEMHEGIIKIIEEIRAKGYRVCLTTTGRRFINDPKFVINIRRVHPDVIALSYDFSSLREIKKIGRMTPTQIRKAWKKLMVEQPAHGQRQKVFESAFTARMAEEIEDFPSIIFNLVVHAGNITEIKEIITALHESFPDVLINPYFSQTAFLGEKSELAKNMVEVSEFINWVVIKQFDHKRNCVIRRAHWWLMIKAAIQTYVKDPAMIADALSGQGLWTCHKNPGAGRYLQISTGSQLYTEIQIPGLRLNCFWNSQTIGDNRRVYEMEPAAIADYLLQKAGKIAEKASDPCPGCAFPRLNFDVISTEIGMDEKIKPAYLELRKKYIGF